MNVTFARLLPVPGETTLGFGHNFDSSETYWLSPVLDEFSIKFPKRPLTVLWATL